MNFTTTKVWGGKFFRIVVDEQGVRVTEVKANESSMNDDVVREVWVDPFKMNSEEKQNVLQVHIYTDNGNPEGEPMTINVWPNNASSI